MCIKDSHLGECLLSTNAREDRRLNFILLRLARENKENLRMQRIQKWKFIRHSYVLHHQPVRVNSENKQLTIEMSKNNKNNQRIHLPHIQTTLTSSESNRILYHSNRGSFFTRNGLESCNKLLREIKTKWHFKRDNSKLLPISNKIASRITSLAYQKIYFWSLYDSTIALPLQHVLI